MLFSETCLQYTVLLKTVNKIPIFQKVYFSKKSQKRRFFMKNIIL